MSHSHHCNLLLDPDLSIHYSTPYGVKRNPILNSLQYFHVSDETLPPDLLHDMLEGYLPYKTKLMLHHFFRKFDKLCMYLHTCIMYTCIHMHCVFHSQYMCAYTLQILCSYSISAIIVLNLRM